MAVMVVELYEALKQAGASKDKAQAAAKAVANYDQRFDGIERRLDALEAKLGAMDAKFDAQLSTLKWLLGIVAASIVGILKTFFP